MQESVFRGTWEIIKQKNFDKVQVMSCVCLVGQLRKKKTGELDSQGPGV